MSNHKLSDKRRMGHKALTTDLKGIGTTRMLTKLITVLSEHQYGGLTANALIDAVIIHRDETRKAIDALHWLVCNRLVFVEKSAGNSPQNVYFINPVFSEMQMERKVAR